MGLLFDDVEEGITLLPAHRTVNGFLRSAKLMEPYIEADRDEDGYIVGKDGNYIFTSHDIDTHEMVEGETFEYVRRKIINYGKCEGIEYIVWAGCQIKYYVVPSIGNRLVPIDSIEFHSAVRIVRGR